MAPRGDTCWEEAIFGMSEEALAREPKTEVLGEDCWRIEDKEDSDAVLVISGRKTGANDTTVELVPCGSS